MAGIHGHENTIDFIIGLPPRNLVDNTNTVMENSMPQARIYPGLPTFTEGLTLFTRSSAFESTGAGEENHLSYKKLLKDHGFNLNQPLSQGVSGCLVIAYQADSFPTDSFTNEYGENFLQGLTDVASEKTAALMQMMGARSGGEAIDKIVARLKGGGTTAKMIGTGLEAGAGAAADVIGTLTSTVPGGRTVAGGLNLVSKLMAGSRIDFPMLWKTSGFQPSYTMTVRLYNPNPGSKASTKKYIIGPIAALMLLGIPVSTDGKTYSWPFIHRIQSPGIYDLDPAFISNITVIKGGDQQQIAYNQKLGIVDVRIDFGSLYNSILASKGTSKTRPTLQTYLDGMDTHKIGVKKFSSTGQTETEVEARTGVSTDPTKGYLANITANQAPTVDEVTDEEKQNPPDRISSTIKKVADDLLDQFPSGFDVSF